MKTQFILADLLHTLLSGCEAEHKGVEYALANLTPAEKKTLAKLLNKQIRRDRTHA